jgi:hypothetical protein
MKVSRLAGGVKKKRAERSKALEIAKGRTPGQEL